MNFAKIKGFNDILPEEVGIWQKLEAETKQVLRAFGFREIRMPLMEYTELFSRGIGEETDVVSKEMYTLQDSKGRGMTLRPEATASMVRAYIEHQLYLKNPIQKLFTIGPMFRHEKPQKGRFRQFHQIDAEIFGDPSPKADAELIMMIIHLLNRLGLKDLTLAINSLGCKDCRKEFREKLRGFLEERRDLLCADCRRRAETNPLRVFDCKEEGCKKTVADAPRLLDFICPDCREHFQGLQNHLQATGIAFTVNDRLVRGLDYYTRTTFEIQTEKLGTQNAVTGGGRYDGLVKLLGGPDHPATGFAVGMERLVALLTEDISAVVEKPQLFMVALGMEAEQKVFLWVKALREAGVWVEAAYDSKGLKAQMKMADRFGARNVLMVGENELAAGKGILRDMQTKEQKEIGIDRLVETLLKEMKS